jgi:carbonic anhydrase/acetyltransferase-like protein (isoleucine patch superfamily)
LGTDAPFFQDFRQLSGGLQELNLAIFKLGNDVPTVHETAFVAESATIIGKVTLGENSSVWPGVVIRGDNERITVGDCSNVQEGAVLHTDPGYPLNIEAQVTIGHQVMLHGCTIKEGSLVGIQAVVLNGAIIGRNCLVGAGAVVTEGKVFPDNSLILGAPAKVVRELGAADIERMRSATASYVERRSLFKESLVRIA